MKLTKILFLILICFIGSVNGQVNAFCDFEAGIDGFSVNATGSLEATISSSTDEFYAGNKSLKIEISNDGNGNIQLIKKFTVEPGNHFSIRFFIKSNQNRSVMLKAQYTGTNGYGGIEILQANINISPSGWTEMNAEIVVPSVTPNTSGGTPIEVFVGFLETNLANDQGLVYYVDSYSITNLGAQGTVFYVSSKGNDSNDGSIGAPLKTIGAAASLAQPGAVIKVRQGTYNEEVVITTNSENSPLTIQAFSNETPVITGVDTLQTWTAYQNNIYYTTVSQEVTQLFVDEQQMDYARWPNLTSNNLFNQIYAQASQVDYKPTGQTSTVTDSDLSQLASIDLIGAKVWLPYPFKTKWNSLTETVQTQTANSISFTSSENFEDNKINVDYHLTGKLELLDAQKEWFYDTATNRLYFYAPSGIDPSTLTVLARTRLNGIVVKGDNVTIKGLDFFASTITIEGDHNLIESCNVLYPRPYYHTERWKEAAGVSLKGKFNTIKKCEVAYSWGSGISMRKLNNNNPTEDGLVEECLVHDVNWSGSIAPGIWTEGTRMTARSNTVYSCGRSGIRIYPVYNSLFEKNHVYDYGKINHDIGGIKGGLQDYQNTTWRYNYTHDSDPEGSKAGIYLDTSNDNALLHHNVMHNVHLSINGEVNNDNVYNNTLVADDPTQKIWSHFIRQGEDWDYRTVTTWNNLSTNQVMGTDLQNNLRINNINNIGFVGVDYGDFRLTEGAQAIDYGLTIANITDGAVNESDVGAFEFKGTNENGTWMPGINWSPDWNQLPSGAINAAVDSNDASIYNFSVLNDSDSDGWIMRYDWDFGDGSTYYGKTVNHQYLFSGDYTVHLTLRDNLGGIRTIIKTVNIEGSLSLADEKHNTSYVYPNPVRDMVTIYSPLGISKIKIIDMSGRIVNTIKVTDNKRNFNISYLNTGLYIFELEIDASKKEYFKVMKH